MLSKTSVLSVRSLVKLFWRFLTEFLENGIASQEKQAESDSSSTGWGNPKGYFAGLATRCAIDSRIRRISGSVGARFVA